MLFIKHTRAHFFKSEILHFNKIYLAFYTFIKMTSFTVHLPDGYQMPEILYDLSKNEWARLFDSVADILETHDDEQAEKDRAKCRINTPQHIQQILKLKTQQPISEPASKTANEPANEPASKPANEPASKTANEPNMGMLNTRDLNIDDSNTGELKQLIKYKEEYIKLLQNELAQSTQRASVHHSAELAALRETIEQYKKAALLAREDLERAQVEARQIRADTTRQLDRYTTNLSEQKAAIRDLSEQFNAKMEPVNKFFGGTNSEKGTGGEYVIYNMLVTESRYTDAIVEDVHGQTAKGDILFKWRKIACMFEVKNKQVLTNADMEKFERDIKGLVANNAINCAVFVSLLTGVFPGRTRDIMQVDICERIPVIYLNLDIQNGKYSNLHYAIACLEQLVKISGSAGDNVKKLTGHFNNFYIYLQAQNDYFTRQVSDCKQALKRAEVAFELNRRTLDGLKNDYKLFGMQDEQDEQDDEQDDDQQNTHNTHNIQAMHNTQNDNHDEQLDIKNADQLNANKSSYKTINLSDLAESKIQIKKIILDLLRDGQTLTADRLLNKLKISAEELKLFGGFKTIIDEVKNDYYKSIINNDVIAKIKKFRVENKRDILRKELVQYKIIGEVALRQLSVVVKERARVQNIVAYCYAQHIAQHIEQQQLLPPQQQ